MKILTVTTVYPSPREPALGIFVRRRVHAMAKLSEMKVIAPLPILNYQRHTILLARAFPRRRSDENVEVLAPRWFYPPSGGAWNALFLFLSIVWPLSRLRRVYRFEVIDSHFAHPDGVAAAMLASALGCPFTITLRGNEQDHVRHPFRRRAMRWALKRAGRVIAVSKPLSDLALSLGVDPSHVVTIPNGIDAEVFHPCDREAVRNRFEIPSTARLILSVGNLVPLKCHHNTIRAVRSLADRGLDVLLWIAGGPGSGSSCEHALRMQVFELKLEQRVRFLGQVPPHALAELMCAADVFCLASSREGWPNVVHESLACGTPVVATRVGGVPEIISSSEYGIVVEPNDPAALTNAIETALSVNWNRERIAEWGGRRSWQQVATEVIREMEAVVARRSDGW